MSPVRAFTHNRRVGFTVSGLVLIIACLLATYMAPAVSALVPAQTEGFNLTASPLPISLTTTPGKQIKADLRVQNSGTLPVKLKVSLLKFKASGATGQPQLLRRAPGDAFFDWVSFSKTDFTAEPGVWNSVTMTIQPPADAAFGYYYAVVFSQDSSKLPTSPVVADKLNGATATLVLLDVNAPGEKRQLAVTSFTTSKKLYEYLPASFSVAVRNTGNVHVIASGDIFISRDHTHNIAVLPINPTQGNVVPDSGRIFQIDWSDGFPAYALKRDSNQIVSGKNGTPTKQLQWDFSKTNKLRFGRYYADLLLTYNDGTKDVPVNATVTFWVIPWRLILSAILILLLPAAIVYIVMRYRAKRLHRKPHKYSNGRKNL